MSVMFKPLIRSRHITFMPDSCNVHAAQDFLFLIYYFTKLSVARYNVKLLWFAKYQSIA